ncbi:MAG: caspase family protein [Cyanobacteria bacterium J06638_22]
MPKRIYALLVGIDDYPAPIPPLRGCVNDVQMWQQYLQIRVAQAGETLHLRVLQNEQATREAIIQGFREHLAQAGTDDVVLFCYSGHGSQEQTPEELWHLEPDRLNETLVCWDSRQTGQWDLSDKELATLLAEVSTNQPHVVVILDCCHSGSGTRDLGTATVRRVPMDGRSRPLSSLILPTEPLPAPTRSAIPPTSGWSLPRSRHLLLAACQAHEEAQELTVEGQSHGLFSYFLLETLQQASEALTYRDLFKQAYSRLRNRMAAQIPQLEATIAADLEQPFLGGAIAPRAPYFTVSYDPLAAWVMDAGTIHGLVQPTATDGVQVALFPLDHPTGDPPSAQGAIATAAATDVQPHQSHLSLLSGQDLLDRTAIYKAWITHAPPPQCSVALIGEGDGVEAVRRALAIASPSQQPSLYVREARSSSHDAPAPNAVDFQVIAAQNSYRITRPLDDRPLTAPISGYDAASAAAVVQHLEHIARWQTLVNLGNPVQGMVPDGALAIAILDPTDNQRSLPPSPSGDISLSYTYDAARQTWQQPTFRVRLTNTSNTVLICALYDLTEDFQVQSVLAGGTVRLEPQQSVWALDGQPIYGSVPKALWQQGVTEYQDILKAIACTTDFDPTLLEQPGLERLSDGTTRSPMTGTDTLSRLMQRSPLRTLSAQPEEAAEVEDWTTSQVSFVVTRPQEQVTLTGDRPVNLPGGITLQPHPALQSKARLTTVAQVTRDVAGHLLPPLLRDHPEATTPLQFTTHRSTAPDLQVLELSDIADPSVVTPDQPLCLTVDQPLAAQDYILPLAYEPPVLNPDGMVQREGFFLPLGAGKAIAHATQITLNCLPTSMAEGNRSLGGAVRILFQKVTAEKLGLAFPYPLLVAVNPTETGEVHYEGEAAKVGDRVATANKVLLYIHGIIGDTQSLLPSLTHAQVDVDGQPQSLLDLYDLVLTFDYESLNTPIGTLAEQLRDRLTQVGLGANHGKTLHIIAHSMGGLVARSLIEQKDGHTLVQHLIMAGTPNGGSPWSTLQDWATTTLTIGLNSLSTVALPIKLLGNLVAAIELIDINLDQMKPGSDFLTALQDCPDPHVPYTVISGNAAFNASEDTASQNRLLGMLEALGHHAITFPFMSQPNDWAATVHSMTQLPEGRSPQPRIQSVSCNHLVYFTHPDSLHALAEAIIHTGILTETPETPSTMATESENEQRQTPLAQPLRPDIPKPDDFPLWLIGLGILIAGIIGVGLWIWNGRSPQSPEQDTTGITLNRMQS